MSDPKRYLDDTGDNPYAQVMGSAAADVPSEEARRRARLAIGLPPTPGGPAPGGPAPGGGPSGGGAEAAAGGQGVGAGGRAVGYTKWLLAAGVVGVLAGGAALRGVGGDVPASDPSGPTATIAQRSVPATGVAAQAPSPTPPTRVVATASPVEDPPEVVARPLPAASASAKAPSLRDEVASLDRARQAMGSSGAAALGELDRHAREFPGGALTTEATVLRIEALAASGRHGAAKSLAAQVLAAHPRGPYADRVRSLVPDATN